jgi:hypothetical protein
MQRTGRLRYLWLGCLFGCLLAGSLWAQDAPDPALGHLRQLSYQVSQLRALTVKNGQAQQGQGNDFKKQLSSIERNLTQLEANVSTIEQQHQQQIADVKALNFKLIVVIAVLGAVVILLLLVLRRRHGRSPCRPAQASQPPQSMTPMADASSALPETAPATEEAAMPEVPQPTDLGVAPSIELNRIVAGDVQATRNALSEARKGFMQPIDLDH